MASNVTFETYRAHPHSGPWDGLNRATYDPLIGMWRERTPIKVNLTRPGALLASQSISDPVFGGPLWLVIIRREGTRRTLSWKKEAKTSGATDSTRRDGAALDYQSGQSLVETSSEPPDATERELERTARLLRDFASNLSGSYATISAEVNATGRLGPITVNGLHTKTD